MSKTKFTPGTWKVNHGRVAAVESKIGYEIADCNSDYAVNIPIEERRANAQLISAAPDMFEVISALHKFVTISPSIAIDEPQLCDSIINAYKKAMGEDS